MKTIALFLFTLFTAISIGQSPQLIFEATLDGTLTSTEGEEPTDDKGLEFVTGLSGNGVFMGFEDILKYPLANNINSQSGTLSLWVQPSWDPGQILYRIFVLGDNPRNFEMHMDEGSNLAFSVNTSQVEGNPIKVAFGYGGNWKQNSWYFLTYTWDSNLIKIYVNGNLEGESDVGFDLPLTKDQAFHIGSYEGENAFNGVIDELRIYDSSMNSEEVFQQYEQYLDDLQQSNSLRIINLFGEDITEKGITLVDWEGPVRNPAMKYYIQGDDELTYPLNVQLSSKEERAAFNLPSTISKNGPSKAIELLDTESMESFLMSYYMDEDFEDDVFELSLNYEIDGHPVRQIVPVKIVDQDYDRELSYPIVVDFSEAVDPFMKDEMVQNLIVGAAEDWLYYVDGEGIDTIGTGESWIDIGGNDHNFEEKRATNSMPYKGYYLFAYENTNGDGPCICSTGSPNRELLNTRYGEVVPLPTIGALHLNQYGQAFESEPTGWEVISPYENWTLSDLVGTDMYSLVKHEIGHALVFEEIPLYKEAQQRLGFISPLLTEYYGDTIVPLLPESTAHLFGLIDPASQSTPYGGGVENPVMNGGREMLTKLDILIMESVGYPLRDNGVTRPLSLSVKTPFEGVINQEFSIQLEATGGIPVYSITLEEGNLPSGLQFSADNGLINGIPEESGDFPLKFRLKDYTDGGTGVVFETVLIIVNEGSSAAELISFQIDGQVGETIIDNNSDTIHLLMPEGTDLTSLTPMISISEGASISPENEEVQDFTAPVTYTVTSENGAVSKSWTVVVELDFSSSVLDPSLRRLDIFPIPFSDRIHVDFQLNNSKYVVINLMSMNGKNIKRQSLGYVSQWNSWINTTDLAPGIYILQLEADGKSIEIRKIIK